MFAKKVIHIKYFASVWVLCHLQLNYCYMITFWWSIVSWIYLRKIAHMAIKYVIQRKSRNLGMKKMTLDWYRSGVRGPQFYRKSFCGLQFTRKALKISQIPLKFIILISFWDARGPHKCIRHGPHVSRGPRVWDPWYRLNSI
jgi:hypothetical protein